MKESFFWQVRVEKAEAEGCPVSALHFRNLAYRARETEKLMEEADRYTAAARSVSRPDLREQARREGLRMAHEEDGRAAQEESQKKAREKTYANAAS